MTWPACIVACLMTLSIGCFMGIVVHFLRQIVGLLDDMETAIMCVEEALGDVQTTIRNN